MEKKYEVWSHCNRWPTQMEKIWWSAVSLSWVTYPDGKNMKKQSRCDGRPTQIDDMHASLPDLKYRSPPSLMLHRHRVPLFISQSFLCSSDALAHSCASHPISCKCSAHPGLSSTITACIVHQAWPCPQVWYCLIHHEGCSLLASSENYPLIDCVHHANNHHVC